jgi:hypothetical protein
MNVFLAGVDALEREMNLATLLYVRDHHFSLVSPSVLHIDSSLFSKEQQEALLRGDIIIRESIVWPGEQFSYCKDANKLSEWKPS